MPRTSIRRPGRLLSPERSKYDFRHSKSSPSSAVPALAGALPCSLDMKRGPAGVTESARSRSFEDRCLHGRELRAEQKDRSRTPRASRVGRRSGQCPGRFAHDLGQCAVWHLRHCTELALHMEPVTGFVAWNRLALRLDVSPSRLQCLSSNDRVKIVDGDRGRKVAAVQGHSIDGIVGPNPLLSDAAVPEILLHGTTVECVESIEEHGLWQKRSCIHCVAEDAGKTKREHTHVVRILAREAAKAGQILVYRTEAGCFLLRLVLSPGYLLPRYLLSVGPWVASRKSRSVLSS